MVNRIVIDSIVNFVIIIAAVGCAADTTQNLSYKQPTDV